MRVCVCVFYCSLLLFFLSVNNLTPKGSCCLNPIISLSLSGINISMQYLYSPTHSQAHPCEYCNDVNNSDCDDKVSMKCVCVAGCVRMCLFVRIKFLVAKVLAAADY